MDATFGAALGSGVASAAADLPFRNARINEAKTRQEMADLQLQEYKDSTPLRTQQRDAEMETLKAQVYQTQSALGKQQTYDAFQRYTQDGDPKHLNQWLAQAKTNPVMQSVTDGMVRVDRLARTPETEKMLNAAGVKDLDGFFSDPALTQSFLVGTTPDGGSQLIDMNRMYAVSGYAKQASDEQLTRLQNNAATIAAMRKGANLRGLQADSAIVKQIAAATGQSTADTWAMLKPDPVAGLDYVPKTAGGGVSAPERVAAQLRAQDPNLTLRDSLVQATQMLSGGGTSGLGKGIGAVFIRDYMERNPDATVEEAYAAYRETGRATTDTEKFVQDYMLQNPGATREQAVAAQRQAGRDDRTSQMKNTEVGEQAQEELDKTFGGDFLTADITNVTPEQRRIINRNLNRMEQVAGLELSNDDRTQIRKMGQLFPTLTTAGTNLTEEQTGLIDSTLGNLKTYIYDSVPGKEGTAAYNTARTIFNNAMLGTQISKHEQAMTNKAFGSLGQGLGPVLTGIRQQMILTRDNLKAIADLNDPYVVKARLGVSQDKVDRAIQGLDDRLNMLNRIGTNSVAPNGSGIKVNVTPVYTPGVTGQQSDQPSASRPSLDTIFSNQGVTK